MDEKSNLKFYEYLSDNSYRQIDWIFITTSETFKHSLTRSPNKFSTSLHHVLSDVVHAKTLNFQHLTNCCSIASGLNLFSVIFELEIQNEFERHVESLFFKLKNGGFCRVVNLNLNNRLLLSNLCEQYNIYFDDLS